jgi:hypothetical protein
MTMGLWMALIASLLAILIETLVFWKRRRMLKEKEQCFRFHDLRDRLQLLALEHQIDPNSKLHNFLLSMINIAIRNAGVIKLSALLDVSRIVKNEAGSGDDSLQADIRSHTKDVQALASEVFASFSWMLVVNDDLTFLLFKGLRILTAIANDAVVACVKSVVSKIAPKHVQVVREANDFDRFGQRLARSY